MAGSKLIQIQNFKPWQTNYTKSHQTHHHQHQYTTAYWPGTSVTIALGLSHPISSLNACCRRKTINVWNVSQVPILIIFPQIYKMLGHENQFTKLILTYTEVISEAESSFLQKFYVMSFTTNWISFAPKYV